MPCCSHEASLGTCGHHAPLVWVGAPEDEVWSKNPLPSLSMKLAAVESRLAVAVLTRCSVPAHLQVLQNLPAGFELPALGPCRSRRCAAKPRKVALYELLLATLAHVPQGTRTAGMP